MISLPQQKRGASPDSELSKRVEDFFSQDGPLSEVVDSFEVRDGQLQFSLAIANAIEEGHSLIAEAGTGIGKTIGYLVPAVKSGLRVVISTGTKTLQEQLLHQDLPLVQEAAKQSFDVALLKGRANYLCEARFLQVSKQGFLPHTPDASMLNQIIEWRQETQTGDRSELVNLPTKSPLWNSLSVGPEQCIGSRCSEFENCWSVRVRRRAQECQILVVNHHLYFADVALRANNPDIETCILPPHDLVIFDEAHEIEEISADYFGYEFSEQRIRDLSQDLNSLEDLSPLSKKLLVESATRLELEAASFFNRLPFGKNRATISAKALNQHGGFESEEIQRTFAGLEAHLGDIEDELAPVFLERLNILRRDISFILGLQSPYSLVEEVSFPIEELEETEAPVAAEEIPLNVVPFVRFMEPSLRNRKLVARPLQVGPFLEDIFQKTQAILVSATLSVNQEFRHIKKGLGLDAAVEARFESPFDYNRQSALYIADDLPLPNDSAYAQKANERILKLLEASEGGALVLCTSHRRLVELGSYLEPRSKLRIMKQGDHPRQHLLQRLRGEEDSSLIATLSFWRGVDIPGRSLRLVIIDKLPFASPDDPVVAGRVAHMKSRGENAFFNFQIPHATLLLRQGFGRLIRNQLDQGLVVILDKRIVQKGYGKRMLKNLPTCPHVTNLECALELLAQNAKG